MFHESFMEEEVSWMFQGSFHDFQGCFMIFKGVSRVFQGSFKKNFKVFQKKFNVSWHSSQLPEQKEGLFLLLKNCKTVRSMDCIVPLLSFFQLKDTQCN